MSKCLSIDLVNRLVYLDTGYIADMYEVIVGESPKTQVTKNQGGKTGILIPGFSAEVNAQETRSFPLSILGMLSSTIKKIETEPGLDFEKFSEGMCSKYGWVEGELTVFRNSSSTHDSKTGESKVTASSELFQIVKAPNIDLALITTPEYFVAGLGTFVKLQETLLKNMSIPIRAYVRVMAAKSHTDQWIATPLLILERHEN